MGLLRLRGNNKSLEVLSSWFYVSHVSCYTCQVARGQICYVMMCYVNNSDLSHTQRHLIVSFYSMKKYQ